ncbi:MAG: hypothetical protein L3J46_05380 [Kangiellaceae bacterium]|nr:hypothetical protein [Kangiellaceae bacterium]
MFPWSGLSFLPGESMQQGVDFSELGSITFDAKTTTDSQIISVLIFQQGSFQPFEQKVELNKFWKNYRVELASFAPLDLENVVNVSIVVNNKQGPFEFDLDNLKLE